MTARGQSQQGGRQAIGQAWLAMLSGAHVGRRYSLKDSNVIGRDETSQVMLDDPEVSRRHARVFRGESGFLLEDLGSQNGTLLNGAAIDSPKQLAFGDKIQLGSQLLLFTQYDRAAERRLQRQRLETLGRLGAGIAHDFNNMLSVVKTSLDYIDTLPSSTTLSDMELASCLKDIRAAAERAAELTPRLASFARSDENYSHALLDLSALCLGVLRLARRTFDRRIVLKHEVAPNLAVNGDAADLHQVLLNLCLNARDAMPEGGQLTLKAQLLTSRQAEDLALSGAGPYLVVMVQDTGIGMEEEVCKRIFDPSFSTKLEAVGHGYGLAEAKEIVTLHGGRIGVRSAPGKGTTCAVYLPAYIRTQTEWRAAAVDVSPTIGELRKPERRGTILLVDDEQVVRRAVARILRAEGYSIMEAGDGNAAAKLLSEERQAKPDLIIMDLDMPHLSGEETQRLLRRIDPNVPVLALSGHHDETREAVMRAGGAIGFLRKPCSAKDLLSNVAQAVSAPRVVSEGSDQLPRRQAPTRLRK